MESLLAILGFLALVYGSYMLVNSAPLPPTVKGSILVVLGLALLIISYYMARRRARKEEGPGAGYA